MFKASVGVTTAIIIGTICTLGDNFIRAAQISLGAIVGHILGILIPAFLNLKPKVQKITAALTPLIFACFSWLIIGESNSMLNKIIKFLDNNNIFYWSSILFTLFEGYQMYLFIFLISEKIQTFLENKMHNPKSNSLSIFIVSFVVVIVFYAVSIYALIESYVHVTSLSTTMKKEYVYFHVVSIAIIGALSFVLTVCSYGSGNIGVHFSSLVTLYVSIITRNATLSVKGIVNSGNGFTKVITKISSTLSTIFSGRNSKNILVSGFCVWNLVGVIVHGVAVMLVVLYPRNVMRKIDISNKTVLMKLLVTFCVLFGLLSVLIGSLAMHTNTQELSPLWKYCQCVVTLLASIDYVRI